MAPIWTGSKPSCFRYSASRMLTNPSANPRAARATKMGAGETSVAAAAVLAIGRRYRRLVPADLVGAVTVVTDADTSRGAAHARAVAAAGARAVVLCGADGAALGALARELQVGGCRSALFLGDATADAADLVE